MNYGRGHQKSARAMPEEGSAFEYTADNRAKLEAICARYPDDQRKSAILAALYLVQHQQGYITRNAIRHVGEAIGCTAEEVEEVVSFYTMFYTRPVGRYVLQVCRTLSCALMLNAVNLTFVAVDRYLQSVDGQIIVFFVITVAAAEAAVGLAIVIALFRHKETLTPDAFTSLKW